MAYLTKYEKADRTRFALVIAGALPLIWWAFSSDDVWASLWLDIYLLTAMLFGYLLPPQYPPIGSRWFWKSMVPLFAIHLVTCSAIVKTTDFFSYLGVKFPTRTVYGLVAAALALEYAIAVRLIRFFDPSPEAEIGSVESK
jgi:hypothetical protein